MKKYTFQIECNHTPEIIDRILAPVRKRGLTVSKFSYEPMGGKKAVCILEIENEEHIADGIYKNLGRIIDVNEVKKVV